MAKKFANCVAEAVRNGVIDPDEAETVMKWYDTLRKQGADDSAAKSEVAENLVALSRERERRSRLAAKAYANNMDELQAFRNVKGEADMALAHRLQFYRRGDEGTFPGLAQDDISGESIHTIEYQIKSEAMWQLEKFSHEFRRHWLLGDLARTSKIAAKVSPRARQMQSRALDVVKAMRGEDTSDPLAKELAKIMKAVSNKIRLAYNQEGGMIGELADWAGPQVHNSFAVREFGQAKWVKLTFDLLDRERMVNPITKRKMSDTELMESLNVVWERIANDGFIDEATIQGVPTGRGALWSQHADHRFLHFKSAEAWLTYARQFGNDDPYASFVGWISVMSRDLAAMKKFGPNPNVMIPHLQAVIEARSKTVKTTEILIAEGKAKLKELNDKLTKPNPEFEALNDRLGEIHIELAEVRRKTSPVRGSIHTSRTKAKIEALQKELFEVEQKLNPFHSGDKSMTVEDHAVADEYKRVLDSMRDSVLFANVRNPVDYARVMKEQTNTLWNLMRGATGIPVRIGAAEATATVKSFIQATMLPMSVLSAIADPVFGATKRMRHGGSFGQWNPLMVLKDTLVYMAPDAKRYAAQSGVVFDTAINVWQRQAQEASRLSKMRAGSAFLADRVLSVGLLIPYTEAGKAGSHLWLMGMFANEVGSKWDNLKPETRETLKRGGFNEQGWDTIRGAKLDEPRPGAYFLRPTEIYEISPELSRRYIGMIARESAYAVIETTPESRALTVGNTRPGTLSGEVVRAGSMLKGFPIAVLFMWWGQLASDMRAGNHRSAASTTASLVITGMFMGAFAMMLKDVAAGRDPRKMFDEETYLDGNFWMAALLQAGGLGIFGDFLFSEVNRSGGNLGQTIAGPVVDRFDTLKKLTVDNLIQLARGKDTRFGAELTRFLRQNVPTVLWNKLLMERVVWDQFQRAFDPEAPRAFQRQINQRKKEYGQDFWYAPGSSSPRLPDLTRAFATRK